ncbi:TonB-dependent siderophore receptor [Synoicihabitans lomoniglobus]|uniref:TonB-dependent receptor plug domain-containing protein n=1 Tax=Synoicihabitans lomoniglobus TaxID=2909285 RepID=A0AAF0CME2_9BACT|nr:hypothetical protein [Opitutaceae bacterium LMO-M01]WED63156.1 hypothetical protein PXH66_12530 [Opitutaceae bacterium LMO-M01]
MNSILCLSRRYWRMLVPAVMTAIALPAVAQTTTTSSIDNSEVIELSPFTVDASDDSGYTAANTLAGSRLNQPLLTSPAPISVMTREFLDDINATDVMQALDWGVNTTPLLQESESANFEANVSSDNAVFIRGLAGSQARNYFRWSVASDSYNVDRLDLARGPNNILFGTGGVGGIVNVGTKRARIGTDIQSISLMVGSNDAYRATIDVAQTLNERAAVRVNAVWDDRGDWINNAGRTRKGVHLAATFKLTSSTTLRLDGEQMSYDRVIGRTFPQLDKYSNWNGVPVQTYGAATPAEATGIFQVSTSVDRWTFDAGTGTFMNWAGSHQSGGGGGSTPVDIRPKALNMFGPDDYNNIDADNVSVFLEQRVGENLFFELAFNRQSEDRNYRRSRNENLYLDANAQLPDGSANPNLGYYYVEGTITESSSERTVEDFRASASYAMDFGDVFGSHRVAAVVSRRDSEYQGLSENERELISNTSVIRRKYLAYGDGRANTGIPPLPTNNPLVFDFRDESLNGNQTEQNYWQLSSVSKFWDDRINITLGLRNDTLDQNSLQSERVGAYEETLNSTGWSDFAELADERTSSYGIVAGLTQSLFGFYNSSENFNTQGGRDVNYDPLGPRAGESWDGGLKFRLFENKLNGSIAYYETADAGGLHYMHGWFVGGVRSIWNTLEPGRNQGGFQDRQDSSGHGWELDLTSNPTKNLRVSFNVSRGTVKISNHGKFFRDWMDENLPRYEQAYNSGLDFEGNALGDSELNNIRTRLDRIYSANTFWWRDGISPLRQREYRANLFANYSFTEGLLNGFSVGAGMQYRDAPLIDYSAGATVDAPPIIYYGNEYTSGTLKLGYATKLFDDRVRYKVQLNISNLFQNDMTETVGALGDQEGGTVNYRRPREFFLTNTFSF